MKLLWKAGLGAVAVAAVAAGLSPAVGAATFTVASSGQLVAAVEDANDNPGADTIRLQPGVYPIGHALRVVGDLTVDGPSAGPAVLDGGGSERVFEHSNFRQFPGGGGVFDPGSLRLDDLQIRNAVGAVYASGDGLHLERVTISDDLELAVWLSSTGPTTLTNSTLSGNKAGILVEGGPLTLRNVTITGSYGSDGALAGSAEAFNTLIAGNPGGDCRFGTLAGANNLDGDGSCGPSALTTAAPQLGPLQDNGGSTPTHAPVPGSLAVDGGSTAPAPATDQRGVTRPQGAAADIGAVELTPFAFESASGVGSVTTDAEADGATASDPVETSVAHPGAAISIREGPDAPAEIGFLGQRIAIDVTPDATAAAPIVISFAVDVSVIPPGQSAATIVVRKDGVVVGPCTGPGATPDPCVASRTTSGDDAVLTVHTSTASDWDLAPGSADVKEQLRALIQDVVGASRLSPAAKALLIGRLDQLLASFDPGNARQRQAVCVALQIFKTAARLQAGRTITHEQADDWIADANVVRTVLGC
jgi:hypothetical protein